MMSRAIRTMFAGRVIAISSAWVCLIADSIDPMSSTLPDRSGCCCTQENGQGIGSFNDTKR